MEEKVIAFTSQTLSVLGLSAKNFEERSSCMISLVGSWMNKELEVACEVNCRDNAIAMIMTGMHTAIGQILRSNTDNVSVTRAGFKEFEDNDNA